MKKLLILFILSATSSVLAQQPPVQNPADVQLTPQQAEALKQAINQAQQQGQLPPPQNQSSPSVLPVSGDPNQPQNLVTPVAVKPPENVVITNSRDLEKKMANRIKDPFMLPNHIYAKIKRKLGDVQGEGFVDESVEPQRRWALKYYKLVGVIWNVKAPKAMITDRQGVVHMFKVKEGIANNEGIITAIHDGEVVVNEKGTEVHLKLGK